MTLTASAQDADSTVNVNTSPEHDIAGAKQVGMGTVLIVEDNAINQLVTRGMLLKLGYQVRTADNGAEALELLRSETIDAVLLDCQMPVMDGFSCTEAIRQGDEITIISWGTMVHVAQKGIEESGIDAELIDLQTLLPWDRDTVVNSVKKTGRCVIVHEAPKTSGFGAEMSASIQERCFWHLESPILRVTGWDTPFPHTTEWDYLPSPERISEAIKKTQED